MTIAAPAVLLAALVAAGIIGVDAEAPPDPASNPTKTSRIDRSDDLIDQLFAPAEGGGSKPSAPKDRAGDLDSKLRRELGEAAISETENPLLEIGRQMRSAERLIRGAESGPRTQRIQEQILADLDALIRQARSRSNAESESQAAPKVAQRQSVPQPEPKAAPGKPDPESVADRGAPADQSDPERPDMEAMKNLLKQVWGELPETERNQMLQWVGEEFLPKYERLIEQYFKRLAEESPRDWP